MSSPVEPEATTAAVAALRRARRSALIIFGSVSAAVLTLLVGFVVAAELAEEPVDDISLVLMLLLLAAGVTIAQLLPLLLTRGSDDPPPRWHRRIAVILHAVVLVAVLVGVALLLPRGGHWNAAVIGLVWGWMVFAALPSLLGSMVKQSQKAPALFEQGLPALAATMLGREVLAGRARVAMSMAMRELIFGPALAVIIVLQPWLGLLPVAACVLSAWFVAGAGDRDASRRRLLAFSWLPVPIALAVLLPLLLVG